MKDLYLAFRANTIDQVIESTPNEARYFVGYVGWRPGELKKRDRSRAVGGAGRRARVWVFRKDTDNLWEDGLQQASKRIRALPDLPLPADVDVALR